MKKNTLYIGCGLLLMVLVFSSQTQAKEESIDDILVNPASYWNTQVTLIGEVQSVSAGPAGTAGGTYTILDNSCPNTITIRTNNLPAVGHIISVSGIVLPDQNKNSIPIIKELERTPVRKFSSSTLNLLIGLGSVLFILIIVFVVILLKPKKSNTLQSCSEADTQPENQCEAKVNQTIAIPMPGIEDGETQFLQNPIAELQAMQGNEKGMTFKVYKNTSAIGRSGTRANDIILTDNTVSKEQALLHFDPGNGLFSITNQSGKNQTKVNGSTSEKPMLLKDGDLIEMGIAVLRFKIV